MASLVCLELCASEDSVDHASFSFYMGWTAKEAAKVVQCIDSRFWEDLGYVDRTNYNGNQCTLFLKVTGLGGWVQNIKDRLTWKCTSAFADKGHVPPA